MQLLRLSGTGAGCASQRQQESRIMSAGKPLIIFGTGELAEVASFYFRHDTDRQIAGFVVDSAHLSSDCFLDKPVYPFEDIGRMAPPDSHDMFVAVGYSRINGLRRDRCLVAREKGYALASYVSSRASVFADLSHGWNCFILEDSTIQPYARIGNGVTLWSGSRIGHHSSIGDFAFVALGAAISGGVKVGERSFIGANATLNDHLGVGERCIVGSGAVVIRDLADESVVTTRSATLSTAPSSRLWGH
jgi:sugar O-acyltransferase (sialic acid O-acetyltransferase NeuD family)